MRSIVEERKSNIVIMDVFSKLIQERVVFIDDDIDDNLANAVIAQMLYLDSISDKPITVYINSAGGNVTSGLAIYDISKLIKSPIITVGFGRIASMAAVLLLMGKERKITKNARVMLHQASGGTIGTIESMRADLKIAESLQETLYDIIREKTHLQSLEQQLLFDKWFTAQECLSNGIVDKIL